MFIYNKINLYILILILLTLLIFISSDYEFFASGPSFDSISSGDPVNYRKPMSNSIRRWRNPVPDQSDILGPARQVTDDVWNRTYDSGIGFQLG